MKKFYKKISLVFSTILLFKCSVFSQCNFLNAPVTMIGSQTAAIGSAVVVPLIAVSCFNGIGAISLRLYYNPTQLTFVSTTNVNPILAANMAIGNYPVNTTSAYIAVVWSDINGATLTDGSKMFDANFTFIAGPATISFDNTSASSSYCEYASLIGDVLYDNPTSSYYINGLIQIPSITISGTVVYNNSANTVLGGIILKLMNGTTQVATATTNASGFFSYANTVANGTYTITAVTTRPWGGVTAIDVLKMKRHIASLEIMTEPIRLSAADVNNSNAITATDVLKLQRRIAGLDLSFTKPDWNFEKVSTGGNVITLNNSDVTVALYGLCAGDVNGSLIPATIVVPVVSTASMSNIAQFTATCGGDVTSDGGSIVTARGVCWSQSQNPTVTNNSFTEDGNGIGSFTSNITGLSANTTYFVRAYAMNSVGAAYGNEISFTTTLTIGQSYQGGIIAYILQSGDPGYIAGQTHGLIAAPSDQSTGIQWYNGSYSSTGATATALGTGNTNTIAIVNTQGAGSYAAKLCYDLVLGGYSDWYLPSKDELNKLYQNQVAIGSFTPNVFWSSSEFEVNFYAWTQNFAVTGVPDYFDKNEIYRVRAIRAF